MIERGYEKYSTDEEELESRTEFEAIDEETGPEAILDAISEIIVTEENENLISDIRQVTKSVKSAYENSSAQEKWNKLWARVEGEVLEPLIEFDDVDGASQNWSDIKMELLRLSIN